MKKNTSIKILLVLFFVLAIPLVSIAANDLIPCGVDKNADLTIKDPCDFNKFLELINNVINFVLFKLAIPIAAIVFMYGGYEMVTSGGNSSAKEKAKKILTNTILGLIFAGASFIIVKVVLTTLGYDGSWIFNL